MEHEEKPLSTLGYGLVGIAAVVVISIALLGIIFVGAPADRFTLTSVAPPASINTE